MPGSKRKPLKTHADVAREYGVTTKTVAQWRDNFPDFPERTAAGTFRRRDFAAFCRRHELGPFNPDRTPEARASKAALKEATRQKVIEQCQNLKITNERLRELQRKELEGIVARDDVNQILALQRDIVLQVLSDRRDKALAILDSAPADPRVAEARPKVAQIFDRVIDDIGKILQTEYKPEVAR